MLASLSFFQVGFSYVLKLGRQMLWICSRILKMHVFLSLLINDWRQLVDLANGMTSLVMQASTGMSPGKIRQQLGLSKLGYVPLGSLIGPGEAPKDNRLANLFRL